MDDKARRRFGALLGARRDALLASGPDKIEPNRRDSATSGVPDDDEQALSEMLQTLASTRNRESAQLLAAIDRALAKLADRPDEYGTCEDCEEDIPARRLEVMPWAALCTECQSKQDPKRNVARKKLTDYR
jgi:DnaK suppressor protein